MVHHNPNDQRNAPQANPSLQNPHSTPSTNKSSSIPIVIAVDSTSGKTERVNKEVLEIFKPLIKAELQDAMVKTGLAFVNQVIPLPAHWDIHAILDRLSEGPDALYVKGDDGKKIWKNFPKSGEPTPVEHRFASFYDDIAKVVHDYLKETDPSLERAHWSGEFATVPVESEDCRRKPDLVTLVFRYLGSGTWKTILSIHEVKTKESASAAILQLAQYARLIFRAQPNRRYVVGSFIIGRKIHLAVFDRSGVVSSIGFKIDLDPETFLHIIVGTLFLDPVHLGFDPTIVYEPGGSDNYLMFKGVKYTITEVLYVEGVIRGRGTVCYNVHPADGNPFDEYIIKDSWIDTSRELKEADILRELKDKKIPGVPQIVDDEVVFVEGETDSTARIRASLMRHGQWILDKYRHIEMREHHRIMMRPFGRRLEHFRSLKELLQAIRDVANTIILLKGIGFLHRDISVRNILLHQLGDELRGLLIDYDYCIRMLRSGSSALGNRTGTLPFLSIDSMNPNPNFRFVHNSHHDLESLFYVLIWICTTQSGPYGKAREFDFKKTELFVWNAGGKLEEGLRNIWDAKSNVVAGNQMDAFQGLILDRMDPYFNPIKDCIIELKEALFRLAPPSPQNLRPGRDVDNIPTAFLAVLDRHIERIANMPIEPFTSSFTFLPTSQPNANVGRSDLFDEIRNTAQALMVPNRAMDVQILLGEGHNTLLDDFDEIMDNDSKE